MHRIRGETIAGWLFVILFLVLFLAGPPPGAWGAEGSETTAGAFLNRDVYTPAGELIGEVDDLVLRRSGKIKKITVEYGGILDVGDRLVALPFKKVELRDDRVAIDRTRQQLEKEPAFDYHDRGLRPDYYYRYRTRRGPYPHRFYSPLRGPHPLGEYDPAPPGHPYVPSGDYYDPNVRRPRDMFAWAYSPARFLASSIMNRRLINESGKRVGWVEDLVIDRDAREVVGIVVASEEILGEDVQVVLDYEPLGVTAHGLVYEIEPEELRDRMALRKE